MQITIRMSSLLASCLVLGCGASEGPSGANPFASDTAGEETTDEAGETTTSTSGTVTTDAGDETPDPVTTATTATTMPSDDSSTTELDTSSGSTDAQSTGAITSGSDSSESGNDTFNDGTVDVVVSIQSTWAEGECDDVTVTNVSDALVMWEIDLLLPGTIYQLWNAELTEMDGTGTFVGVDFNAALDPGEVAMFGFCVTY